MLSSKSCEWSIVKSVVIQMRKMLTEKFDVTHVFMKVFPILSFFFTVPIRSCREFFERCNSKSDGLYTIYLQKPNAAETANVFCDMTHDDGGWTLLVTSASNQGWSKDNVKTRYDVFFNYSMFFNHLLCHSPCVSLPSPCISVSSIPTIFLFPLIYAFLSPTFFPFAATQTHTHTCIFSTPQSTTIYLCLTISLCSNA